MKLSLEGMRNRQAFEKAGICLPAYDPVKVAAATKKAPRWAHFGIGNIFRIFMGSIADTLIEKGEMNTGITCLETFDFEVTEKIYKPYDNLALCVTLHSDGTVDKKVTGSLSEAIALCPEDESARKRAEEIFTAPSLQMVSFTITEKGYELKDKDGEYFEYIKQDLEDGPAGSFHSAMPLVTALLVKRFEAGAVPVALVSMDNVSQNGSKLRNSVLEIASCWKEKGFLSEEAFAYISDESKVSFPWTMIDKITPRPDEGVRDMLTADGMEDMDIVITGKKTYIAPFVNAEGPQYLVIEDSFPNGRPAFEKAGVYMTDRETVNASERMKVTVCLNPVHSALGPYGEILGISRFSDVMKDPDLLKLADRIGPVEGMEVVVDPKILSPKAFMEELLTERFPNPYIPDTCQRLCVDISQMVGVRFGVTIKAYMEKYGDAGRLIAIPLAIAGYMRYLLGIGDDGTPYELAPDPINGQLQKDLLEGGIKIGEPESLTGQLHPILSNEVIFGVDLYKAGIGETIEQMFREEIEGPGAVRKTLRKYLK